ncbi:MAG: hypothetical protein E4H35_02835 [Candidatus Aminicenantes bacterium]|nr:MAG: hypothetical protein E4H35_02835 [Candidatus Aminicenantes bacterium]
MLASAILKPGKTMRGLLKMQHPARLALLAVGGVGFLYILTSAVLAVAGAVPTAPVFFGIDVDNYYFWQMIFVLPMILAAWFVSTAVIRILDGQEKDRPGFGGMAALAGVALSSALFLAWIPSAVEAAFMAFGMGQGEWVDLFSNPGPWQTAYLAVYAAAAALVFRNFILAARILRKRSWPAALLAGIFAAAMVSAGFVVFVR